MASGARPGVRLLLDMLELAPAAIGLLSGPELRWTYANHMMIESTGRTILAELLGKTIRESFPELEGQGYFEMLDEAFRTGRPFTGKEQKIVIGKRSGPAARYVNFSCQPLAGDAGHTEAILLHLVDVTTRVAALRPLERSEDRFSGTNTGTDSEVRVRKELEENQGRLRDALVASQRLAAIVESSDDAIISKDLNGVVTSWNSAATHLFGYAPHEIIGRSILTIIPPELHAEEPVILENIRTGRKIDHYETERIRKDGTRVKVALSISPVRDPEGRVIGASKIARDITERMRLQEAIMQSEKLAATGRMAAAIAHEINNPLEAVTNLAYLLTTDPTLSNQAKAYAELLLREIGRVSHVAKQSLGFFRDNNKPGEFDICELVAGVIEVNQRLLDKKRIRITRDFAGPCTVFGSAAELRQVFANLLSNAMDAVGERAQIRIRVRSGKSGIRRILVADNGHGIPAQVRARLFEPFVTSKGTSGNGLGLWVSHGIVRKHGGSIRVKTSTVPGRSGTIFSVNLPRTQSLPGARSPLSAALSS